MPKDVVITERKCKFCSHIFTKDEIRKGLYYKTNIQTVLGVQTWDDACMFYPDKDNQGIMEFVPLNKIGKCYERGIIPVTPENNVIAPKPIIPVLP